MDLKSFFLCFFTLTLSAFILKLNASDASDIQEAVVIKTASERDLNAKTVQNRQARSRKEDALPNNLRLLNKFVSFVVVEMNESEFTKKEHLINLFQKLHPQVQRLLYSSLALTFKSGRGDKCKIPETLRKSLESLVYYVSAKNFHQIRYDRIASPHRSSFERIPIEVIALISEYIGAKNPLPEASRQMNRMFTGTRALKYQAAKVSGFEWVKSCSPSKADIDSLQNLPRFRNDRDRIFFFLTSLVRDKFKSIAVPLLSYSLDLYRAQPVQVRSKLIHLMSLLLRTHYHYKNLVKLALAEPVSAAIFLPNLTFEELLTFVKHAPVGFIGSISEYSVKFSSLPYFMIAGAPQSEWLPIFEALDHSHRIRIILNFIVSFDDMNSEAIERLKLVVDNHVSVNLVINPEKLIFMDTYFKVFKGSLNVNQIFEKLELFVVAPKLKVDFALAMINLKKFRIAHEIIKTNPRLIQNYLTGLVEIANRTAIRLFFLKDAFKFIYSLGALSKISEKYPINHTDIEAIFYALFLFYRVESVDFLQNGAIKLNCEPVSRNADCRAKNLIGYKISFPELFHFPLSISISRSALPSLVQTIDSRNHEVLEKVLQTFLSDGHLIEDIGIVSESFLVAAQTSDRFYEMFFSAIGTHRFVYNNLNLYEVFNYPIGRLIDKVRTETSEFFFFDRNYNWNKFLILSKKICFKIYKSFGTSIEDLNLLALPFFTYWIQSDQWESLKDVRDASILDYLEPEYPDKVAAIRLMKEEGFYLPFSGDY